jgi:hypothetical protein
MVLLYHYTSAEGCNGILRHGVIKSSTDINRDAVLGKGVYLTSLPPSTDDWKLIENNWDGNIETFFNNLSKTDYYIVFDSNYLPRLVKGKGDRNVWMVPYDIHLDKVPHKVNVRGHNVQLAKQYGYL